MKKSYAHDQSAQLQCTVHSNLTQNSKPRESYKKWKVLLDVLTSQKHLSIRFFLLLEAPITRISQIQEQSFSMSTNFDKTIYFVPLLVIKSETQQGLPVLLNE